MMAPLIIESWQEMERLGQMLSKASLATTAACIISLTGPLGAGKTTLVRGFLRGFGFKEAVKSPTYTLVEPYHFENRAVYHFDFYRLSDPEELMQIGIRDYFHDNAYCLMEWPQKAGDLIPKADVDIVISIVGEKRAVSLQAGSERGSHVVQMVQHET